MIRVATYNIRKSVGLDRQRRPERILDILNEIRPDIIALQEVDRRIGARVSTIPPELIERETDLKVVNVAVRPDSIGWHGNVLLVRKDALIHTSQRLILPTYEPRGAIYADITLGSDKIRVVGTHLGLIRRIRSQQVLAIAEQLKKIEENLPTLIMGDLNEWQPDGSLTGFGDTFEIATPGPSFHSARPVASLDRIILSNRFDLLKGEVHRSELARTASDHLPIYADIRPI